MVESQKEGGNEVIVTRSVSGDELVSVSSSNSKLMAQMRFSHRSPSIDYINWYQNQINRVENTFGKLIHILCVLIHVYLRLAYFFILQYIFKILKRARFISVIYKYFCLFWWSKMIASGTCKHISPKFLPIYTSIPAELQICAANCYKSYSFSHSNIYLVFWY